MEIPTNRGENSNKLLTFENRELFGWGSSTLYKMS